MSSRQFQRGFIRLTKKSIATILIVITLFTGTGLIFLFNPFGGIKEAEAAWFDDNWGYRQRVDITYSSTALTDFQLSFTLNTSTLISAGKMQSDCDDIRVSDVNGRILPHWIDGSSSQTTGCNQTGTVVWTKVPSITANTTLYVYYGNPSTINTETGEKVFTFYDDFETGGISTIKWDTLTTCANSTQQATTSQKYKGSYGVESYQSSDCGDTIVQHSFGGTGARVLEIRFYDDSTNTAAGRNWLAQIGPSIGDFSVGVNNDTTSVNYVYRNGGSYTNSGVARSTGWHKIRWIETASTVRIDFDGTQMLAATASNYSAATALSFGSYVASNAGLYWDSAFVRQYAATEPTVGSPGSEERTASPVAYWKMDEGTGTTVTSSGIDNKEGTVTYRSSAQNDVVASSMAINKPAGTVEGDIMIALIYSGNEANTVTPPSGWIYVRDDEAGVGSQENFVYYKTAGSSEGASYTFTFSGSTGQSGAILTYSGANTGSVVDISGVSTGSSSTASCPTVTTTVANDQLICFFTAFDNGNSFGSVSGMTEREVIEGGSECCPLSVWDKSLGTAGASGANTASLSISGTWIATAVAIKNRDLIGGVLNGDVNGASWQTEDMCISGKCLRLDGSNDVIAISDNSVLDFAASSSFTVSAWVKHNGAIATNNDYILAKANGATYTGYKLYMDNSGDFCFTSRDGTNAEDSACTSSIDFDDDKWHLVQGVKSGTSSLTLYVDGNQRAQDASLASTGTLANASNFFIGADMDGTSNPWQGFIDELKVYPQARSADQIKADFSARSTNEGAGLNFAVTPNNSYNSLNNGLVGYWKMEEAGDASRDDSSGNGTSLAESTSDTIAQVAGKFGNAGDFELGDTEYLFVADNAALSVTGSVTLSAWIKPETVSAGSYNIFGKWDGSNESYRLFQNGDEVRIEIDAANQYVESNNNASLAAGTWYHVVGVYDASSATAKIYLNGAELSTTSSGTIPSSIGDDGGRFQIGAEDTTGGATGYYDGVIDEARVYNRALSSGEVTQLYNFAPGPVGYWKMDESTWNNDCSTDTIIDSSGYSNYGDSCPASTGPTGGRQGKLGKAGYFDGSDDRVNAGSGSSLDDLNNLTIEAWINPQTPPNGFGYIIGKSTDAAASNGWMVEYLDTNNALNFQVGTSGTTTNKEANNVITDGVWQHIAITWDGVTSGTTNVQMFVNGVKQTINTSAGSGTRDVDSSSSVSIGSSPDANDEYLGYIDDVKIYNYIRTNKQIVEDVNASHPAPGSPVGSAYGHWRFEEGNYNTCSGGSNDICNSGSGGTTNDGALTSASATFTTAGKFGKALSLASNANASVALDPTASASQLSWSMWVKPTSLGTNVCLFCKYSGITGSQSGGTWAIIMGSSDSSKVKVVIPASTTSVAEYGETPTGTLATSTWTHIVVVYDGTQTGNSNRLNIYINGKKQTLTFSGTIPATTPAGNATPRMGADSNNANLFYTGLLDEVKVYLSALTESQAALEYNQGSSQSLGVLSTTSAGVPITGAEGEYCIPGDSATCTGPVGRWDLDERTGTTAYDRSGTDNNLTLTNSPTYTIGKAGAALSFAGSNAHLTRADDPDLDFAAGGSFTWEAWIKHNTASAQEMIIVKHDAAGYKILMESDGDITCGIDYDSTWTPTDSVTSTAATYDDNLWHHIACVKNANTSLTLYIDGVSVGTPDTSLTNSTLGNGDPLYIGIDSDGAANDWIGQIDNVRLFNYARSNAQVAWDYNQGKPIAHWRMDECQGTTINDSSGNSLSGTLGVGSGGSENTIGTCSTSSTAWGGSGGTGAGKRNYAISLDGTDDYITAADNSLLDITGDFTIEAWGRREDTDTNDYIVSKGGALGTNASYIMYYCDSSCGDNGNKFGLYVENSSGSSIDTGNDTNAPTITDTNWHHLVTSYSTSGTVKVYIDGVLRYTATGGPTNVRDSTVGLGIGAKADGTNALSGAVDNVKIYNYVLTDTQVKTSYNEGAARFGPSTGAP